MTGLVVLFAGPAGAGKSTLARAWCQTRQLAAHVQLDDVRSLIVSGLVDPRAVKTPGQSEQWRASVDATCALAISFAKQGIDVAIDDLLYPGDAEQTWAPQLAGVPTRLVVVLPTLAAVLTRGRQRSKHVPENLVVEQYAASARWPTYRQLDTTDLDLADSLELLVDLLARPDSLWRHVGGVADGK